MSSNDRPFLAELTEDQIVIKNTVREFAEKKIPCISCLERGKLQRAEAEKEF